MRGVSPAAAPRGAVSGPRRGTRVGAAAALRGPLRRKRRRADGAPRPLAGGSAGSHGFERGEEEHK